MLFTQKGAVLPLDVNAHRRTSLIGPLYTPSPADLSSANDNPVIGYRRCAPRTSVFNRVVLVLLLHCKA